MRKFFTLSIVTFVFSLVSYSGMSQSLPALTEQIFYVQASALDVNNYPALHNKVKNDGRFTIATACVPAHVIAVKVVSVQMLNNQAGVNSQTFHSLIGNLGLGTITIIEGFTNDMFMEACKNARSN